MKTWVVALGLGFASLAGAVELGQASNDQILAELGRRLSGSTPPPAGGSSASYVCDGSGYLYIYLTGPDGKTVNKYFSTPGTTQCGQQASVLNQKKTRINRVTIAAVCDSSGYLYRVTLLPDGKIGEAPYNSTAGYTQCTNQATALNGG